MQNVSEFDAVRLSLSHVPRSPADEAVDRVRMLRFRQRQLMATTLELVAAVLETIGPGDEHLTSPAARHLVDAIAGDDVPPVDGVGPETTAHLDCDRPVVAEHDLELLSGGRLHRYAAPVATAGVSGRRRPATTKERRPIAAATIAASA